VKILKRFQKWMARTGYAFGMVTLVWPAMAFATTSSATLPWDATLTTLQNDIGGPVAKAVVTAAVVGTGLMWGVSEHGTGVRKASAVAFGGATALGAATFMGALFGTGALF
jgi:type IV secretory pathway VirB2 component (pilin)